MPKRRAPGGGDRHQPRPRPPRSLGRLPPCGSVERWLPVYPASSVRPPCQRLASLTRVGDPLLRSLKPAPALPWSRLCTEAPGPRTRPRSPLAAGGKLLVAADGPPRAGCARSRERWPPRPGVRGAPCRRLIPPKGEIYPQKHCPCGHGHGSFSYIVPSSEVCN